MNNSLLSLVTYMPVSCLYVCIDDMLLLGTIHRRELHCALDNALCLENKLVFFSRKLGISTSLEHIGSSSDNQQGYQQEEFQVRLVIDFAAKITKLLEPLGLNYSIMRMRMQQRLISEST